MQLMQTYEISALYTSPLTFEGDAYSEGCLTLREEKEIEHIIVSEGDTLMFGSSVQVQVFNPPAEIAYPDGFPTGATTFITDHSPTLKFTFSTSTLLLAGDLYASGERAILARYPNPLDCAMMKANHHGGSTYEILTEKDRGITLLPWFSEEAPI